MRVITIEGSAYRVTDQECEKLEEVFTPYFDEDIFVLYQESDGFVICVQDLESDNAPSNYEVKEAFKNIKSNEDHYR